MSSSTFVDGIEVMWRPGCPFCMRLRSGLSKRGIATTDIDIWTEPDAAARVRAATGGDETVPTVFIGGSALVNPSVKQVIAALESELPDRVDELVPPRQDTGKWRAMFGFGKRATS
ncbi:MAG: glutaredoxin domain-containing protein [Rhodococcus sp. (in: high G+C Gram-positive bacteria)]|uniref:glutaredoxin domain-containing protein n=1 Tax=unclassified Rhodococcus (in: high G+C Gram-positive bacteria) TaxID=192944 RepID=UPI000AFF8715|nr:MULTISPECIES: glutaredoxin domain-containing protein [unclassified Rhodococcus (in: high G+C Gram-positive bacteria)]RMB78223.1 NrdH-redoxin [Rhodococcus sp. SBT000017]